MCTLHSRLQISYKETKYLAAPALHAVTLYIRGRTLSTVQAETVHPGPAGHSSGDLSSVRLPQFARLNGAQACAGAPKRQLVFRTEFVPNHYATAVSTGQGVGGALRCIFVLGAVICQTDRAYDEPLNTLLRDTQVCSK